PRSLSHPSGSEAKMTPAVRASAIIESTNREVSILHKPRRMIRTMPRPSAVGATLALAFSCALVSAQTVIKPPDNKYTPAQDVELGEQAAKEMRQQLPILDDDEAKSYVEGLGRRLVAAVPAQLRHPEFRYTFDVVNVREINAS